MLNFVIERESLWERLKKNKKPVVLYGMGDGAQKVIDKLNAENIPFSDIFASDEFVRGHSFYGIRVKKYSEICSLYDDFFILVCFAVDFEPMLSKIFSLDVEHETAAPDVPLFGEGIFDTEFVNHNEEKIKKAYELLADEQSKKVFSNVINYKISGKLCYLRDISTDREDDLKNIFSFTEREKYLDLGAYDGDTVKEFFRITGGKFESVTALEPDEKNFRKLSEFARSGSRVTCLRKAVWDSVTALNFSDRAGRNSALRENGRKSVVTATIDELAEKSGGFTFIKMDVEGAERRALLGGSQTIKKYKPKLFVSAYHRNEDIFDLILTIHKLNPNYEIFLRKHPYIPSWEVNILAR